MEALLLIDIQNDYFPGGAFKLWGMKRAAQNAAKLLKKFRENGAEVIHIQHISIKPGSAFFLPNTNGAEIHHSVIPRAVEKLFIKHYPNSFRKTGLLEYLKEKKITDLHIVGAMTNMCVDSTVRAGFDFGYKMILHKKACAARGVLGLPLVHLISVKTLGSVFATVQ